MPVYKVTDPTTGLKLRLTGDSQPTEQELEEIFSKLEVKNGDSSIRADMVSDKPVSESDQRGFIQKFKEEVIEPTSTVVTGGLAEIPAGLAGIAGMIAAPSPESVPMKGAEAVEATRAALTYVPKTEAGSEALERFGEFVEPVTSTIAQTEEALGRAGMEIAGPEIGALAKTIPTAGFIAIGFPQVRKTLGLTKTAEVTKNLTTASAKNLLKESAPSIEGLKEAANKVYRQIDETGAVVKIKRVNRLSNEIKSLLRKEGYNKRIHPKIRGVIDELTDIEGKAQPISEIDTLRKISQSAASSIEASERRLGSIVIDRIDEFLDSTTTKDFVKGKSENIGPMYKDARQLWSRAKKAEMIDEAITRAKDAASGFENGIRNEFRSILRNKKKLRGFTAEEINAMRGVVHGTGAANLAKHLGKFGFSEKQAGSMLLSSLGVAGGASVGGPLGAIFVPAVGQFSRNLAQKLTRNNAAFAESIIRAGKQGTEVVRAYMKATKPSERNALELSELLIRPQISLNQLKGKISNIPKTQRNMVSDAIFYAGVLQSQQEQE